MQTAFSHANSERLSQPMIKELSLTIISPAPLIFSHLMDSLGSSFEASHAFIFFPVSLTVLEFSGSQSVVLEPAAAPGSLFSSVQFSSAAQSCPTLFDPARLLCPWDFPGRNTGVGCHFLLQGIFLTQGLNPGLPHCRQTLYHLSHQGSH